MSALKKFTIMVCLGAWWAVMVYFSVRDAPLDLAVGHDASTALAGGTLAFGVAALLFDRLSKLPIFVSATLVSFASLTTLELVQHFTDLAPGRAEYVDLVAAAAGSVIGALLLLLIGAVLKQRTQAVVTVLLLLATLAVPLAFAAGPTPIDTWTSCGFTMIGTSRPAVVDIRVNDGIIESTLDGEDVETLTTNVAVDSDTLGFRQASSLEIARAESLLCAISTTNRFSATIEIRPESLGQEGPARILAISTGTDSDQTLVHIGQDQQRLSVRVRTRPNSFEQLFFNDFFLDTEWRTIRVTLSGGIVEVTDSNGFSARQSLETEILTGWSFDWPITVGNEQTGDRQFAGTIRALTLQSGEDGG